MKYFLLVIIPFCIGQILTAQSNPSAIFELESTDQGILIPRTDTTSVNNSYPIPATGLLIYDSIASSFYVFNGLKWQKLGPNISTSFIEDEDQDTRIYMEETPLDDKIKMRINGIEKLLISAKNAGQTRIEFPNNGDNIALGTSSLFSNTTGIDNVALGHKSLYSNTSGNRNIAIGFNALYLNTLGGFNIAIGDKVLRNNTSGVSNIALGFESLFSNTSGDENIALGAFALNNNTTGNDNIAIGRRSLLTNTISSNNIAIGLETLLLNSTGNDNIAMGIQALRSNTTGDDNIAIGEFSLRLNTTGDENIAIGEFALRSNTSGNKNIAIGNNTLLSNSTGSDNIAMGKSALISNTTGDDNIAIGIETLNANTTGEKNIAIGERSLEANTSGTNNIGIGLVSLASNTIGLLNIGIGAEALQNNTAGNFNTAIGISALKENINGQFNIAVGNSALLNNTSGQGNVAQGGSSLLSNSTGSNNTAIGSGTLFANSTGSGNVAIGNEAGFNEIGSNKLYIENSNAGPNDALIYGEFNNDLVRINNKLGVNTNPGLFVAKFKQSSGNGINIENTFSNDWEVVVFNTIVDPDLALYFDGIYKGAFDSFSGNYFSSSDRKLKENINNFTSAIAKIKLLGHAKTYNFKADSSQETRIGFIAQDLLEVFPEFVNVPNPVSEKEQHLTVDYAGLSSVALSAIYEQQEIIESQEARIKTLEEAVARLLENNKE